jgi:hypothetical protein
MHPRLLSQDRLLQPRCRTRYALAAIRLKGLGTNILGAAGMGATVLLVFAQSHHFPRVRAAFPVLSHILQTPLAPFFCSLYFISYNNKYEKNNAK